MATLRSHSKSLGSQELMSEQHKRCPRISVEDVNLRLAQLFTPGLVRLGIKPGLVNNIMYQSHTIAIAAYACGSHDKFCGEIDVASNWSSSSASRSNGVRHRHRQWVCVY